MENPRSWVVSGETNGHVVTGDTSRDDITADGVVVVVDRATSAANDGEFVLSKALGTVIFGYHCKNELTPWRWKGCGLPVEPPGMESSMTELEGRV